MALPHISYHSSPSKKSKGKSASDSGPSKEISNHIELDPGLLPFLNLIGELIARHIGAGPHQRSKKSSKDASPSSGDSSLHQTEPSRFAGMSDLSGASFTFPAQSQVSSQVIPIPSQNSSSTHSIMEDSHDGSN